MTPNRDPDFDPPDKSSKAAPGCDPEAAIASLEWSYVALLTWWLPILGQVFPIAGLIRGYQGRRASNRIRARAGMLLSTAALILGLAVMALMVLLAQSMREMSEVH
jgi:hypothetical protein